MQVNLKLFEENGSQDYLQLCLVPNWIRNETCTKPSRKKKEIPRIPPPLKKRKAPLIFSVRAIPGGGCHTVEKIYDEFTMNKQSCNTQMSMFLFQEFFFQADRITYSWILLSNCWMK